MAEALLPPMEKWCKYHKVSENSVVNEALGHCSLSPFAIQCLQCFGKLAAVCRGQVLASQKDTGKALDRLKAYLWAMVESCPASWRSAMQRGCLYNRSERERIEKRKRNLEVLQQLHCERKVPEKKLYRECWKRINALNLESDG